MLETRADDSAGEVEMRDDSATPFISPSSSPGQPSGVVLPLSLPLPLPHAFHPSSHAMGHPSPPPTPGSGSGSGSDSPSGPLRESDRDPSSFSLVGKDHVRPFHQRRQGDASPSGGDRRRSFSRRSDAGNNDSDPSRPGGEDAVDVSGGGDVSDGEEVIDVIGDDSEDTRESGVSPKSVVVRKLDYDVTDDDVGVDGGRGGGEVEVGAGGGEDGESKVAVNDLSVDDDHRRPSPTTTTTNVTNFSIAAILKPDFGPARKLHLDYCYNSNTTNNANNSNSPQSRPRSPLLATHPHPYSRPLPHLPSPVFSLHEQYLRLHHPHRPPHHHPHPHLPHLPSQDRPFRQQGRLSPPSPASPVDLSTRGKAVALRLPSGSPADLVTGRGGGGGGGRMTGGHVTAAFPPASSKPHTKNANSPNKGAAKDNHLHHHHHQQLKDKKTAPGLADNTNSNNNSNNNAGRSGGAATKGSATVDSKHLWPAWVFCTRYSDRPSSGPRSRRVKRSKRNNSNTSSSSPSSSSSSSEAEKRPRTAFTTEQLSLLKREFDECRYLTEARRRRLASELGLSESQIKIWFQNKRAKIKKSSGVKNELALQLMAQGLYNHSTITVEEGEDGEDV